MPEIEQKELETLKASAGEVEGLKTTIEKATQDAKKATASYTSLEESGKATVDELEKLKTVHDEELNKKATDDAELTKLRAATEKFSVDENALVTLKAEKETVDKELTEYKDRVITSTRGRLHTLGMKEDDTKDKEITILEAMEAGALATTSKPGGTGSGAGLGGGSGNLASPPTDTLQQNVDHIKRMRENPRGGARKVG